MSQENVEIVREANAAFNRRDLDHWIEFFDPEIEYHDTPGFPVAVCTWAVRLFAAMQRVISTLGPIRGWKSTLARSEHR